MAKIVKKSKPPISATLSVVGLKYRDFSEDDLYWLAEECHAYGTSCLLEAEPTNKHDPKAIMVIVSSGKFEGRHLGYIRRPANEPLFDVLRSGAKVKVCELIFVNPQQGIGEVELVISRPKPKAKA